MPEDTIREFQIGDEGITLGEPLHDFRGIVRGIPTYVGRDIAAEAGAISGNGP